MESLLILMYLLVPMTTVERPYIGGGTGIVTYSHDDSSTYTMLGLHGKIGAHITDYFASELRYGISSEDSQTFKTEDPLNAGMFQDTETDVYIKHYGSAYLVSSYPVTDTLRPYALLGYSKADLRARPVIEGRVVDIDESRSGFSYGIGFEHKLNEYTSVGAEYVSVIQSEELGDINMLSATLKLDFSIH